MSINTQGINLFIKTQNETEYKKIGCLQSLGDLDLGKKSAKEDGCMNKDVQGKIIGQMKYGNLSVGYTYSPEEPEGQGVLVTAHETHPAPLMDVRIELPNKVTEAGNGTQFDFKVYVTERSVSFPKDDEMQTSATLEMEVKPTVNPAT